MNILNWDLFPNKKLTTNKPFVERRVPEYPVWMKQPKPGETFDKALLRPTEIHRPWPVHLVIGSLVLAAFATMALS